MPRYYAEKSQYLPTRSASASALAHLAAWGGAKTGSLLADPCCGGTDPHYHSPEAVARATSCGAQGLHPQRAPSQGPTATGGLFMAAAKQGGSEGRGFLQGRAWLLALPPVTATTAGEE